jgi:hypothetical protein
MRLYPTECGDCEEEFACEYTEDGEIAEADLCPACDFPICCNCVKRHDCSGT